MRQYYTITKVHLQGDWVFFFFLVDHQGEDKDAWVEKCVRK